MDNKHDGYYFAKTPVILHCFGCGKVRHTYPRIEINEIESLHDIMWGNWNYTVKDKRICGDCLDKGV